MFVFAVSALILLLTNPTAPTVYLKYSQGTMLCTQYCTVQCMYTVMYDV